MHPAAAHLASVAAAPELDVVGMGADRERRARHVEVAGPRRGVGDRRLAGFVAGHRRLSGQLGAFVPVIVPGTGSAPSAAETRGWISGWVRSATVSRSSESSVSCRTVTWRPVARAASRWWRNDARRTSRGASIAHGRTMTLVPSRRRSGTMTMPPGRASAGSDRGIGRSPWLMIDVVEALPGDRLDTGVDGTVETEAGSPQHRGAERLRPLRRPRRRRTRRTSAAAGRRR